jgi:DNA polymerase III alpha subunit (gram-positive type)
MSLQADKGIRVPAADAPFSGPAASLFTFALSFEEALYNLDEQDLVFLDFETTGLTTGFEKGPPFKTGCPVQIAMIRVKRGAVVNRFVEYMDPGVSLCSWAIAHLKNSDGDALSDAWVQTKRSMSQVLLEAVTFLGDTAIVVGHNCGFDIQVFRDHLQICRHLHLWKTEGHVDSLAVAKAVLEPTSLQLSNLQELPIVHSSISYIYIYIYILYIYIYIFYIYIYS